ncbi:hypothetical protein D9757_005464 [Collybiopsis confluens]|uniref:Uncharacterized protein n=1 Tax=Collybiopsis confluens TaxID=2823264 RepID=A0A8H5HLT9_9AGAR|nr:hypothetical protein D9757_005464 [Collybiopsis confluens]
MPFMAFSSPTFTSPSQCSTKGERKRSNPLTPIRNLLQYGRDYLRFSPTSSRTGAIALGKRRRTTSGESEKSPSSTDRDKGAVTPSPRSLSASEIPLFSSPPSNSSIAPPSSSPSIISSPPPGARKSTALPPPPPTPRRRVRAAIQNLDETYNAIVITALEDIPFRCHEDLLSMSRERLINVANTLNAKLPAALRIDIADHRSDVSIRKSIEVLVGISKPTVSSLASEPPGAPKAVKSRKVHAATATAEQAGRTRAGRKREIIRNARDEDVVMNSLTPDSIKLRSSPEIVSSPLGKRSTAKSSGVTRLVEMGALARVGTPKLARLEEEDESPSAGRIRGANTTREDEERARGKKRQRISNYNESVRSWSGSLVRKRTYPKIEDNILDSSSTAMDVDVDGDVDVDMHHSMSDSGSPSQAKNKTFYLNSVPSAKTPTRYPVYPSRFHNRHFRKSNSLSPSPSSGNHPKNAPVQSPLLPDALKKLQLRLGQNATCSSSPNRFSDSN